MSSELGSIEFLVSQQRNSEKAFHYLNWFIDIEHYFMTTSRGGLADDLVFHFAKITEAIWRDLPQGHLLFLLYYLHLSFSPVKLSFFISGSNDITWHIYQKIFFSTKSSLFFCVLWLFWSLSLLSMPLSSHILPFSIETLKYAFFLDFYISL